MSGENRLRPVREPAYDPADPQSGRALVDYHLRELGLGEEAFVRVEDGMRLARVETPPSIGVCRAHVLTEAAWPRGAELCVTVDWTPDAAQRRDVRSGRVPPSAEDYWRERIAATADALESCGYVVEPSRFRCSPHFHFSAELLVYRMRPGQPPRKTPADAVWALSSPVPPNYQQRDWHWPDKSPQTLVRNALRDAGLEPRPGHRDSSFGQFAVRDITQTVWPPEADRCAWVVWWPAAHVGPAPGTGLPPAGDESRNALQQALDSAGFVLRLPERPWRPGDETADFLAYRVASPR